MPTIPTLRRSTAPNAVETRATPRTIDGFTAGDAVDIPVVLPAGATEAFLTVAGTSSPFKVYIDMTNRPEGRIEDVVTDGVTERIGTFKVSATLTDLLDDGRKRRYDITYVVGVGGTQTEWFGYIQAEPETGTDLVGLNAPATLTFSPAGPLTIGTESAPQPVTVTALRVGGAPSVGVTVTIGSNNPAFAAIAPASGITDLNGEVTFTLSPGGAVGTATVTAQAGVVTATLGVTAIVILVPTTATLTATMGGRTLASTTTVDLGYGGSVVYSATVRDQFGDPMPGEVGTFSAGSGSFSSVTGTGARYTPPAQVVLRNARVPVTFTVTGAPGVTATSNVAHLDVVVIVVSNSNYAAPATNAVEWMLKQMGPTLRARVTYLNASHGGHRIGDPGAPTASELIDLFATEVQPTLDANPDKLRVLFVGEYGSGAQQGWDANKLLSDNADYVIMAKTFGADVAIPLTNFPMDLAGGAYLAMLPAVNTALRDPTTRAAMGYDDYPWLDDGVSDIGTHVVYGAVSILDDRFYIAGDKVHIGTPYQIAESQYYVRPFERQTGIPMERIASVDAAVFVTTRNTLPSVIPVGEGVAVQVPARNASGSLLAPSYITRYTAPRSGTASAVLSTVPLSATPLASTRVWQVTAPGTETLGTQVGLFRTDSTVTGVAATAHWSTLVTALGGAGRVGLAFDHGKHTERTDAFTSDGSLEANHSADVVAQAVAMAPGSGDSRGGVHRGAGKGGITYDGAGVRLGLQVNHAGLAMNGDFTLGVVAAIPQRDGAGSDFVVMLGGFSDRVALTCEGTTYRSYLLAGGVVYPVLDTGVTRTAAVRAMVLTYVHATKTWTHEILGVANPGTNTQATSAAASEVSPYLIESGLFFTPSAAGAGSVLFAGRFTGAFTAGEKTAFYNYAVAEHGAS